MDKKVFVNSGFLHLLIMALSSSGFSPYIRILLAAEHQPHSRTSIHSNCNFPYSASATAAVSSEHDTGCTGSCCT